MSDYPLGTDAEEEDYMIRCRMADADDELAFRDLCEREGEKAWQFASATNQNDKEANMKMSEAFPSKWLKAADLKGRAHLVTISEVGQEEIGQSKDLKLVMYFVGKEKGMVLNVTNANVIASKYGDDTDAWNGAEIELYPDRVNFNNQMVDALRVRLPVPPASANDSEVPF